MPRIRLAMRSGMERLEVVDLLPRPDEVHGPPGDVRHRQRRASASVTVELRQDEAGGVDLAHERARLDHGVLTGHRVARHQDVMRASSRP